MAVFFWIWCQADEFAWIQISNEFKSSTRNRNSYFNMMLNVFSPDGPPEYHGCFQCFGPWFSTCSTDKTTCWDSVNLRPLYSTENINHEMVRHHDIINLWNFLTVHCYNETIMAIKQVKLPSHPISNNFPWKVKRDCSVLRFVGQVGPNGYTT